MKSYVHWLKMLLKRLLGLTTYKRAKIKFAKALCRVGIKKYCFPAANNIDRRLVEILGEKPGTFVEVGANDGYSQSNTFALETLYEWSGLLVEPIPYLYDLCLRTRPNSKVVNVALGPRRSEGSRMEMYFGDMCSIVTKTVDGYELDPLAHAEREKDYLFQEITREEVEVRELSCLIDEFDLGPIHLLSIDVEGYELPLLDGLDLKRHQPHFMVIESWQIERVKDKLKDNYECVEQLSPHDYLFRLNGLDHSR